MKLYQGVPLLAAALMAPLSILAECDEETTIPLCIADNGSCLDHLDGCCEGLACFGYNFFKKCQTPPTCLAEWYDCSQGMDCCEGLVCASTSAGIAECQVQTVDTRLFDPGNLVGVPTVPPKPTDNLTTLGKSNLEFAGAWGDPRKSELSV